MNLLEFFWAGEPRRLSPDEKDFPLNQPIKKWLYHMIQKVNRLVKLPPNGQLGILVADVVDKGVGAVLYMALSRTLLRTYFSDYPAQPELVFDTVNQRIWKDIEAYKFVTVFYGILDPATGSLVYSNAGHSPPYLISAKKNW